MVKGKKASKAPAKAKPIASVSESSQASTNTPEATRLQQQVLDIFKNACAAHVDPNDLQESLQQVKGHLFKREFLEAFGKESFLWAYASRYSPSRALGYLQIFQDISTHLKETPERTRKESLKRTEDETTDSSHAGPSNVDRHDQGARPPHYVQNQIDDRNALPTHKLRGPDDPPAYDADAEVPAYENAPAYPGNSLRENKDNVENSNGLRIACLGGGAGAELIAAAAWLRADIEDGEDDENDGDSDDQVQEYSVEPDSLQLYCIDIANWANVVEKLHHHIITPPVLSRYASAAAQATNSPLLPEGALRAEVVQQDLLEADQDSLRAILTASDMVTIMFTLNELYTTSVSKTQRLLFELTVAMRPGTLLLVVDSPGSYSSVTINGTEKKYPMQWLLDHTLLETSRNTRLLPRGSQWEKLMSDESRWFRLPKGLKYPIELENMRYQIHLYRRREV